MRTSLIIYKVFQKAKKSGQKGFSYMWKMLTTYL